MWKGIVSQRLAYRRDHSHALVVGEVDHRHPPQDSCRLGIKKAASPPEVVIALARVAALPAEPG
jgi:hypothetical protein